MKSESVYLDFYEVPECNSTLLKLMKLVKKGKATVFQVGEAGTGEILFKEEESFLVRKMLLEQFDFDEQTNEYRLFPSQDKFFSTYLLLEKELVIEEKEINEPVENDNKVNKIIIDICKTLGDGDIEKSKLILFTTLLNHFKESEKVLYLIDKYESKKLLFLTAHLRKLLYQRDYLLGSDDVDSTLCLWMILMDYHVLKPLFFEVDNLLRIIDDTNALIVKNKKFFDILEQRFIYNKTLQEIGKQYGLTRERIRQIQAKGEEKIAKNTQFSGSIIMRKYWTIFGLDKILTVNMLKYLFGNDFLIYVLGYSNRENSLGLIFDQEEGVVSQLKLTSFVNDLPEFILSNEYYKYGHFLKEIINICYLFSNELNCYYSKGKKIGSLSTRLLFMVSKKVCGKYYKVYDDEQKQRLQDYCDENEIHVEIGTHALDALISRYYKMCGRGLYDLEREKEPLDSALYDELLRTIKHYPVILYRGVFELNETILKENGINNVYELKEGFDYTDKKYTHTRDALIKKECKFNSFGTYFKHIVFKFSKEIVEYTDFRNLFPGLPYAYFYQYFFYSQLYIVIDKETAIKDNFSKYKLLELADSIDNYLKDRIYISIDVLWAKMKKNKDDNLQKFPFINGPTRLKNFLKYALDKTQKIQQHKIDVDGNVVFWKGKQLIFDNQGIYQLIKNREEITFTEIINYINSSGMVLNEYYSRERIEKILQGKMFRTDFNNLIAIRRLEENEQFIKKSRSIINDFLEFKQDAVRLADIKNFKFLPSCDMFKWNRYAFFSFVLNFMKDEVLINGSQDKIEIMKMEVEYGK